MDTPATPPPAPTSPAPPVPSVPSTPPIPSAPVDTVKDIEHLRILSICHYVMAGLAALGGCFPIIHLVIGIALIVNGSTRGPRGGPPVFMGWFFAGVAAFIMIFFWTLAILLFIAGRNLARCRRRTFCFVVACIACLQVPMGTTLGIFTIIVLSRPAVKAMFEESDLPLEVDSG